MDAMVTLRDACTSGKVFLDGSPNSPRYQFIPEVNKVMAVFEFRTVLLDLDNSRFNGKLFVVTDEQYS